MTNMTNKEKLAILDNLYNLYTHVRQAAEGVRDLKVIDRAYRLLIESIDNI